MLDLIHRQKAFITEIFSSIQGEGIFLGAKQIFVRFRDCNLSCAYCDEKRDGPSKEFTPLELISEIKFLELSQGPHHSVSLTGGEPLLYSDYLKTLLKSLKKENLKGYLETNGTLPDKLDEVIDLVDIIAMDIKLPSSTGHKAYWKEHLAFLKIAVRKKVFVKAIVTPKTKMSDIRDAALLVSKVDRNIPFILQPVTAIAPGKDINKDVLLKFAEVGARNRLENVRVIPQVHKMLGVK
ncbi:organic radical activating enzyme [sediment metagenome]|uniref:Organic radical activating enzyme n=1 Tax=sediment metagenome TaxID=749907 RepID=D9PIC0_9ZZZZ